MNYTANQLSVISAIIARAAVSRNWESDADGGPKGKIEEVQCMELDGKLYIAGNHSEHDSIAAYLTAFGVRDETSFLDCLRYSHWLLSIQNNKRKESAGNHFKAEYSDQEILTLGLAILPFAPLADDLAAEAKQLVKGEIPNPDERQRGLGWFLRRFVGAANLKPAYGKSTKGKFSLVTDSIQSSEVNVINNGADVHAELKLLKFLAENLASGAVKMNFKEVNVGGLKKACDFCNAWIGYFNAWMYKQYKITVVLPHNDTNRSTGGGAGDRPYSAKFSDWGDYVKALFNGGPNSKCADMVTHQAKELW